MPSIRFIGLTRTAQRSQFHRLCMTIKEAAEQGRKTAILVSDKAAAQWLDDFLWTFDEASFVPHQCSRDASAVVPVVIVQEEHERIRADLFINFTARPLSHEQLQEGVQLFELFRQDLDEERTLGREKWAHYRQLGLTPEKVDEPNGG